MGELDVLKVRDELLQAMYWMHAEKLAEAPSAKELSTFLAVPADTLKAYIDRFVLDGYLEPQNGGYALTESGREAGKKSFADEFRDLTRPSHGECDENCWCHDDPEEAAACIEGRKAAHANH